MAKTTFITISNKVKLIYLKLKKFLYRMEF